MFVSLFRSLVLALRAAAERRRARAAFNQLDDATLRDLGLTRGEAASCCLEASGALPATRRRVRTCVSAPTAAAPARG